MNVSLSDVDHPMLTSVPLTGLPGAIKKAGGTAAAIATPPLQLPPLPYEQAALEPWVSARTMSFHYGKHHLSYVENLNKLIIGTSLDSFTLEEVICRTASVSDKAAIYNNAAQVWNHTFFWHGMKPDGGGLPAGRLLGLIRTEFGTFETFKNAFIAAGVGQFGSGWVWLVQDRATVKIVKTSNADTPLAHGMNALLTCDVWEHAYYLDYQNKRKDFLTMFLEHLANWDFAESRLQ